LRSAETKTSIQRRNLSQRTVQALGGAVLSAPVADVGHVQPQRILHREHIPRIIQILGAPPQQLLNLSSSRHPRDSNKGILNARYEPSPPLLDATRELNTRIHPLIQSFHSAPNSR